MYEQQVTMIAEGQKLWADENLHSNLHAFKKHYLLKIASVPTITQMIGQMVKLSNSCDVKNRHEKTRTMYAMNNLDFSKNTSVIKNKITDATVEYWDRSKKRSNTIISYNLSQQKEHQLAKLSTIKEHQLCLKNCLTKNNLQFSIQQNIDSINSFKNN